MPIHGEEKSVGLKMGKIRPDGMNSEKGASYSLEDIKESLTNLAQNIRDSSVEKAHDATDYVLDHARDLKETGTDALEKVERRIKSRPGQSVAIAFTAGWIASILLGRKKP